MKRRIAEWYEQLLVLLCDAFIFLLNLHLPGRERRRM